MSGMFWVALELSISKMGLNIILSLTVKKLDAFKFDGVAESDNTGSERYISPSRTWISHFDLIRRAECANQCWFDCSGCAEISCEKFSRPVLVNGTCYSLYTQGPCSPSQWLTPVREGREGVAGKLRGARCECRPGYEPGSSGTECQAPAVRLAHFLNAQPVWYLNYFHDFGLIFFCTIEIKLFLQIYNCVSHV